MVTQWGAFGPRWPEPRVSQFHRSSSSLSLSLSLLAREVEGLRTLRTKGVVRILVTPFLFRQSRTAAAPAPKLPHAHSSGSAQQRHQRPSSNAHTTVAHSSGTSTQAPTRTQQRQHTAAAPAPKLQRAHSSTTQQRHQHALEKVAPWSLSSVGPR